MNESGLNSYTLKTADCSKLIFCGWALRSTPSWLFNYCSWSEASINHSSENLRNSVWHNLAPLNRRFFTFHKNSKYIFTKGHNCLHQWSRALHVIFPKHECKTKHNMERLHFRSFSCLPGECTTECVYRWIQYDSSRNQLA